MPLTNQITETVPFNFNELYTGLENKFIAAGYDVAQGSNVSQLITAMAYFTSMLNVNTAVNINEMLLPLATLRDNVLNDARALGYEIQHKQSYTYRLTLSFSGSQNGNYSIPKYSVFTEGGKRYYYLGNQIDLTNQPDGTTVDIDVREGELFSYLDYPALQTVITNTVDNTGATVPQYYFDIPFTDIEENGIECFVTYYDNFGNLVVDEPWSKSQGFLVDSTTVGVNEFYRADDIKSLTPRIYFQLNGAGTGLRLGTIVKINALRTSGVLGAMANPNALAGIGHSIPNATVVANLLVTQGTNEESIQSIKLNAPKFYNSSNRAVTVNDYKAFCNRQTAVKDSFIWGGDDEFPKSPGHIWFSFLPSLYERIYSSDVQKSLFTLNNSTFIDWDYSLLKGTTQYNTQYNLSNAWYSSKYVEDAEIRSNTTATGQVVQPGVWDVLDNYKIPTMQFHNRHPVFVHFDYVVEILNYNASTSRADVNQNVFNIIDNFFTGTNDPVKIEQFNVKYFHSSLEKRIDTYLTDASGYNNTVQTRVLLTKKNVSTENAVSDYKDIFIPLSVPFEPYFAQDGTLLYSVLPQIDTVDFIDYRNLVNGQPTGLIPAGKPQLGDLYTDWSEIQAEIAAGTTQQNRAVITAPIRTNITETVQGNVGTTTLNLQEVKIYPSNPATLTLGSPVYDNITVTKTLNGTSVDLVYGTDWTYDPVFPSVLNLTVGLLAGETVTVTNRAMCGQYVLMNGPKKFITVQLYVNSLGYSSGIVATTASGVVLDTPKSYLTTSDQLYNFTLDGMYITTLGYTLTNTSQVTSITGPVLKTISSELYVSSPLSLELFERNRYLNLNYNSPNFEIGRNLMPVLNSVRFK